MLIKLNVTPEALESISAYLSTQPQYVDKTVEGVLSGAAQDAITWFADRAREREIEQAIVSLLATKTTEIVAVVETEGSTVITLDAKVAADIEAAKIK